MFSQACVKNSVNGGKVYTPPPIPADPPGRTGKHEKNLKPFSSQGILKSKEKSHKYWKSQGISDKCYLLFLVIFKWSVYYLLKRIKFWVKKNIKNTGKIGEKSGNFVSLEKWEQCEEDAHHVFLKFWPKIGWCPLSIGHTLSKRPNNRKLFHESRALQTINVMKWKSGESIIGSPFCVTFCNSCVHK